MFLCLYSGGCDFSETLSVSELPSELTTLDSILGHERYFASASKNAADWLLESAGAFVLLVTVG